jgi:hypothetical protein
LHELYFQWQDIGFAWIVCHAAQHLGPLPEFNRSILLPHAHTVFDEPSCMIYVQASILITNRFGHFSSLVMTLPVRTHQLAIQPLKQLLAAPWEAHVASEPEMWNRIIGAFRIGPL